MRYLSVCSGIEAATCAWHPIGWQPAGFSEIEKFPSAVLAHHYPDVPNFGDMTKFQEWPDDLAPDLIVGGTPCQSFSVAGLRGGLADPRGNLALVYLALADRYRPEWLVWENVPGVLSSNSGRDFGAFLGGLVKLGYGFAYRVLDAQYFGVAQRRRRVFVVANSRDWRRAAAVLFERHSLSGHPAPSRKTGQGVAPTIAARTRGGGGLGTDFDCDGGLIASTGDIAHCLNAGGMGRQDYESETMVVTHTLKGEGFDASEDGTGRGTPLVPVAMRESGQGFWMEDSIAGTLRAEGENRPTRPSTVLGVPVPFDTTQITSTANYSNPETETLIPTIGGGFDVAYSIRTANTSSNGWGVQHEVTHTLDQAQGLAVAHTLPVAFDTTQITSAANYSNPKPGDPCHPLAAGAHAPAIAFAQNQRDEVRLMDVAGALAAEPGAKQQTYMQQGMAVRRLTPVECERLQGFEDGYTAIPWRGKLADACPDGPRYKALGNSMAVPCMAWIGRRIQAVSEQSEALGAAA